MVSASATSSMALVASISSHSAVFVAQSVLSFARNSLSLTSASSVSDMSFFNVAISTPSSPIRTDFFSTASVSAAISFFFAATIASKLAIAAVSVLVASANDADISSLISLRMPVISPLAGAYEFVPERKAMISSRSPSMIEDNDLTAFKTTCASLVWRKAPDIPDSRALIAFARAARLLSNSPFSFANSAASFARMAVASAMAAFAASRSALCWKRSSVSCAFFASPASMSLAS
mmetsp:Transcript_76810/g.132909  ORF Transcript_76810/g.132909 Transcript_76810/m.132909 type:complete len:235 (-) Transcript_76810:327-1031(-)